MYSFPKRKMSSLNLDADVYYEILPLIEGMYSVKKFIILSNLPFEPYKNRSNKRKLLGLAKVCKEIDVDGKQIIMPYKNEYVSNLLNDSTCYKIYWFALSWKLILLTESTAVYNAMENRKVYPQSVEGI